MGIVTDQSTPTQAPLRDLASALVEDWHAAYAALEWQLDCGIDAVLADDPIDRYAVAALEAAQRRDAKAQATPTPGQARAPSGLAEAVVPAATLDPVAEAKSVAEAAPSLEALKAALQDFPHCDLKRGARNTVFADGLPHARVMVIGEAPSREDDLEGRPFVGPAGLLLDKMFAAIGLSRQHPDAAQGLYLTSVVPWRPEGGRGPHRDEIAVMLPFLERHIALADPDVLVVLGNVPLFALTGQRGISQARGRWTQHLARPLLPIYHPTDLLRNPAHKREAWADLLALQAFLRG